MTLNSMGYTSSTQQGPATIITSSTYAIIQQTIKQNDMKTQDLIRKMKLGHILNVQWVRGGPTSGDYFNLNSDNYDSSCRLSNSLLLQVHCIKLICSLYIYIFSSLSPSCTEYYCKSSILTFSRGDFLSDTDLVSPRIITVKIRNNLINLKTNPMIISSTQ